MGRPPLSIEVKPKDQNELMSLLSGGVQQVRVILRALALLQLARGASAPQISEVVPLTPQAIRKVGHRYRKGGLELALYESSVLVQPPCWMTARNSESSPWFAVTHLKAAAAGPYVW